MAKRKSDGASVGLIVTLVFFVLATFVAGTVAYFGYEEIDTYKSKLVQAKKDQDAAQSLYRQERIRKAMLRIALGVEEPGDRVLLVQELEPLRLDITDEYNRIKSGLSEKGASITRKELDNLRAEMDKKGLKNPDDKTDLAIFTFDWPLLSMTPGQVADKVDVKDQTAIAASPAVGPLLTLPAMIGIYESRAALAETAHKNAEAKAAAADAKAVASETGKTDEKAAFDKKIAEIQAEKQKRFDQMVADFKNLVARHLADAKNAIDRADALGRADNNKADEIARLGDEIKGLKLLQNKLQNQLGPDAKGAAGVDFVSKEEKKGEIIRKEDNGFVTIDIGSSKKLRPQITFLVVSAGVSWLALLEKEESLKKLSYKQDRQPFEENPFVKAGIEVVEVIGPNGARAKVLFENEPIRNPIQVHDQIFNLAWQPAEEIRVAFAGIIDLDGNGLDNNDEFLRILERQGVVVDEYLKMKPLEFVKRDGKGMSLMTKYLIIAPMPRFDALGGESPQIKEQMNKVNEQMSDIRKRAAELGVQLIEARKFLAMIGYKLPKNPLPPQYGASVYFDRAVPAPMPDAKKDGN